MHAVNVGFSAIAVGLSMAFSLFLVRFFVKEHNAERGVYSYALAFANSGYFGDPIVQMLFGDQVLSYYKLFCLPISMVIYTGSGWAMAS
jgi:predicted permease